MKTKIILSVLVLTVMASIYGQKPTIELTFTAINNSAYCQPDSIKISNLNQGKDTVLYYPDTVLVLEYEYPAGLYEGKYTKDDLKVYQNYPNPAPDQTIITVYIPEKDKVSLLITDIAGRKVIETELLLDKGYHSFRFTPGDNTLFFLTAAWKNSTGQIKILHIPSNTERTSILEYIGREKSPPMIKTAQVIQHFSFSPGDELLYIGYADSVQSGLLDSPGTDTNYIFQFATNIPCPGTPTVTYNGQVYNTIQVFSQCWLKENLNAGIRINGSQNASNNGIIEKYCYEDTEVNCGIYGGLYSWNEMMQYFTAEGSRGICPEGWHIPTDEDWKTLEGEVDSLYGIGNSLWNSTDFRGSNAGQNLKSASTALWWSGEGTDKFGFAGLPGGMMWQSGNFTYYGCYGFFWSSSSDGYASWRRTLICAPDSYEKKVGRDNWNKNDAMSLRCMKDGAVT